MPLYFFDVHDGVDTFDEVGTDLPDVEAARESATEILSDLARKFSADGSLMEHEIIVGENGKRVLKAILTFRCVKLD